MRVNYEKWREKINDLDIIDIFGYWNQVNIDEGFVHRGMPN